MTGSGDVPFDHLLRLSDSTGLYEHARGAIPRRDHGYCVDDVARGLVVLAREPDPSHELSKTLERYLGFVAHAQTGNGSFHNRMGFDRRWHDTGGTGDWWGWFLGDNDLGKPLYDSGTGGCADGLSESGPSKNQGAESTLALISTWQHARNLLHRTV